MSVPYPSEFTWHWTMADGTRITIRPIRPTDRQIEQEFVRNLSRETRYFRFMGAINELSEAMLDRFTQPDYVHELALIAVVVETSHEKEIAVARYVMCPDGISCEFAIVVADAWQRRRVGGTLMACLMWAAKCRGLQFMQGYVLSSNHRMLALMTALGFTISPAAGDPTVRLVYRTLAEAKPALAKAANREA